MSIFIGFVAGCMIGYGFQGQPPRRFIVGMIGLVIALINVAVFST